MVSIKGNGGTKEEGVIKTEKKDKLARGLCLVEISLNKLYDGCLKELSELSENPKRQWVSQTMLYSAVQVFKKFDFNSERIGGVETGSMIGYERLVKVCDISLKVDHAYKRYLVILHRYLASLGEMWSTMYCHKEKDR